MCVCVCVSVCACMHAHKPGWAIKMQTDHTKDMSVPPLVLHVLHVCHLHCRYTDMTCPGIPALKLGCGC